MFGPQPCTVDEVAAALEAGSVAGAEQGAAAFDEARRALRALAAQLDRTLGDLHQAWSGAEAVAAQLAEPARRTREVVHLLDEGEYGRRLRIAGNALAAGQARVRDLRAQRVGGVAEVPYDHQARQILQDLAGGYRDVGSAIGGQSPPPAVPVGEPGTGRLLLAAAGDGPAVPAADPADLFRPAAPRLGQPGDPALPPAGGGAGGGGTPMMPFMPPMAGMGGMGGMGGMHGMGGEALQAGKRNALHGDPGAWVKGEDDGWNVIGRTKRVEAARKEFRDDFDEQIRKLTRGDRDV